MKLAPFLAVIVLRPMRGLAGAGWLAAPGGARHATS